MQREGWRPKRQNPTEEKDTIWKQRLGKKGGEFQREKDPECVCMAVGSTCVTYAERGGIKMQEVDRDPKGHVEMGETQEAPSSVDGGRGTRQNPESESQRDETGRSPKQKGANSL